MANWEAVYQNLQGLSSGLGDYARQKQAKEQAISDMIQKLVMEAKIKQMFPDAASELTQTKNFLEIQKLAKEMNLGGSQPINTPGMLQGDVSATPNIQGQSGIVEPTDILSEKNTEQLGKSPFSNLEVDTTKPIPYIAKEFNIFGAPTGYEPDPIEVNWRKEIVKNRKTAMQNFNETAALLQNTVSVWKAANQELKEHNVPEGLASKFTGNLADVFELPGYPNTKAYVGQVIETAMGLSKIVSGGSRIIRSVINNLIKTLPTLSGMEGDMEAKIGQSFKNSFVRALGRPVTKEEMAYINEKLSDVLDVPPMSYDRIGKGIGKFNTPTNSQIKVFQVGGEIFDIPVGKVLEFINSEENEGKEIYDITGQVR